MAIINLGRVVGKDGVDGKSAYQIWLDEGNTGTEQDFLNSLKGENGVDGANGKDGEQGPAGKNGEDGADGVSVTHSWSGTTLIMTSASGTTSTNLKGDKGDTGEKGEQGLQGPKGETGATGEKGDKGDKGDTGATGTAGKNGTDGVGISSVTQTTTSSEDGGTNVITVTKTDGTTSTFSVKNGSKGSTGATGTSGKDGYSPVKGKDYWTNEDKAEIIDEVITKTEIDVIPDYVVTEAESIADKVLSTRNANTFVMACASDLHTNGSDTSATGVLHVGQAMNLIREFTELDLIAILGDIPVGDFEENTTGSFKYVKKCFTDASKGVPYIHLQGNHDELPSDTTEKAQQRYYAFIGANNVGTVTDYDNKFRNYGYRDFDNYKVRVIYINTADVSENEMTYDNNFTSAQMNWFINTALKLSSKQDASEWGVIVCGHHPLNWVASGNGSVTKVLDVLNAYKGRTSGSVTVDSQNITYDFSGEKSEFICHIHGHLHNFREEVLGTNKVLSITVPNACFSRNNEYGSYDYSTYPDVVKRYGDDGANNDGTGTQRVYTKTSDKAEDTAFSVFCIDRESKIINVFNYGSGIDRKWDYANGVKAEVDDEENNDTPTETYTNWITASVDKNGNDYVGANGEDGYKTNTRISSSSGGEEVTQSGMCVTGYIPYNKETIRLKNVTVSGTKDAYLVEYNADKTYKQVTALSSRLTDDGNGVLTGTTLSTCSWIRITCGVIDDTSILTLNEEII